MTRTLLAAQHLTARHHLPGIALRDPHLTMGHCGEPGTVLAWFNASSIVHKGIRWMVYRTECKRWFLWSQISIVQLDENFAPVAGTNRVLPLESRFDGWGVEDPRMFVFDGQMYVSYGDGYRILLARLSDSGKIERCGPVPADQPDLNPPQLAPREKNWGFFEYRGRLLCQYSVTPTVTIELDPQTWTWGEKWLSPWTRTSVYGDRLHGGSPPVYHGKYLWRWVHCHRTERMPFPRRCWFRKDPSHNSHRYYSFLAAFTPEPPFEPLMVSAKPVIVPNWESADSDGPTHCSVVFVGSAEREGEGWRLFYGENDMRIVSAHVPDSDITMEDVPRPMPRKIRPAAVNFIHFIWLQGADQLPAEDQANIDQWRAMNPDWVVKVWDDDTLAELIKVRAPRYFRLWEELFKQRESRPDDRALTAKASDMARLVLLSLQFEITQSWNFYADTDTRPHRPLTHFINDETLQGANLPRTSTTNVSPSQRPWDIDNYDLLVSEENLMNPHPGYMTNAVMMARPNSPSINELLKAGEAVRNKPTLQAWGPIMLRRTVEALKRTPSGRRIFVLPFHYFVWNPAQMQMAVPEWAVCLHYNKFRWNQPEIQASRAGSARGGRQPLMV